MYEKTVLNNFVGRLQVASTTADLAPVSGAVAQLRLGSTPYDFIGLVYDETYGKWVSPSVPLPIPRISSITTASATFVQASFDSVVQPFIFPYFKRLWDAGLRPQARGSCVHVLNSGSGTGRIGLAIGEFTNGDTGVNALGTVDSLAAFDFGAISTDTSSRYFTSDWVAASMSAPSESHVEISLCAKTDTDTINIYRPVFRTRWVSA